MPSFTRRAGPSSIAPPSGTHPSPSTSLPLLPSGIPSLDDLLGGGLPLGSSLLVLTPDIHSAWGRLLSRYWISQGLTTGQSCCVIGEEDGTRELMKGCMWVEERSGEGGGSESEGEGTGGDLGEGRGGGKIAWRYEGMSKFRTSTGRSSGLNLMKTIPSDILGQISKSGQLTYIDLDQNPSAGQIMSDVLSRLDQHIGKAEKNAAMRITINELGGPDWGDPTAQEIHRFLHGLRGITRSRPVGIIITLPPHLVSSPPIGWEGGQEDWIKSLSWMTDACIEMHGFADNPTLAQTFAPLHGLLTLHQFPTTHTLLPPTLRHSTLLGVSQSATNERGGGGAGANNLGFRVKRKGLVIETAHLGIEGGSGERRTGPVDDVAAVLDSGPSHRPATVQNGDAEGVELVGKAQNAVPVEGEGGVVKKVKKVRAKVRFGGDSDDEAGGGGHDHDHKHGHGHEHVGNGGHKPIVRHDRPDLYEF